MSWNTYPLVADGWVAGVFPLVRGARSLAIHSFYAKAKTEENPIIKAQKESQLAIMFAMATASGDSPVRMCMDLNGNPLQNKTIRKYIEEKGWVGVGAFKGTRGFQQTNLS